MPICWATRRASYTSSSEQQRPCTDSGMPSRPARRRWFQSCMVRPMTSCPSARSMAATVEESTPPDMATAMVRELDIVSSFGVFHVDSTRADRQHLVVRREEQPIVVSLVRIVQIISRRNHEAEIVEDKRCLRMLCVKLDVAQWNVLETSNRN